MDQEIAEKLYQLGFRPGKNCSSEHSSWSQCIVIGNAKVVLNIREFGTGLQYGFLVANASKDREQEQWLPVDDITSAIVSLQATQSMCQRTRREISGDCVKWKWREFLGRQLSLVNCWLVGEHGIRRVAGKAVNEGGTK